MGPIEAHKKVIRDWKVLSGRSTRSEYWWPVPSVIVLTLAGMAADVFVLGKDVDEATVSFWPVGDIFATFSTLFLMPLCARRFQDVGLPGWIAIFGTLPIAALPYLQLGLPTDAVWSVPVAVTFSISVGFIIICLIPSQKGPNRYGLNPARPTAGVFE